MPLPVSLRAVAEEMDVLGEEWRAFLSRTTGELLTLPPPEHQEEEDVELTERIDDSPDWLALPDAVEIHEWGIMMDFARSREGSVAARLERALGGRGAFRTFKDAVAELECRNEWFAFRDRAIAEIAADWLEAHEIPFVRDVGDAGKVEDE